MGDRGGEATTLTNIGTVYQGIGKPEEALKYFNQALPISHEVGDRGGESRTLNNIGAVYSGIGKPEEALKYFNQALPISRAVGDRGGESTILNNIGFVYGGIGKPEDALKYFNQALPVLREVGDRAMEAMTLNNIGEVYRGIGKPEDALKYFNQALPILRTVGDRAMEATTLNNIGEVYRGIGKPEDALKYYIQALPILQAVGYRGGESSTLNNIGLVYQEKGEPEEALKYFNQALPILRAVGDRRVEAITLNNKGTVYQGKGEPEEALKFFNQALLILREVGDRRVEATTLNNIGAVSRDKGKPEEALKYYNQALPILRAVGDRSGEAAILNNIGFVYRDTNQPTNAITKFEASAEIKLSLRGALTRENRAAFINANRGTAIALIDLLIRQKQPEKAYQWANRFTTFNLADYNLLINAKVANPEAQKALDNWNAQNQELDRARQDLQNNYSEAKSKQFRDLEQQINQKREPLINQYSELADLLETRPTDLAQLQKSIPPNTTLLHPILLTNLKDIPNTVAIFRLTRTSLTVTQIPLPEDFNQILQAYAKQLSSRLGLGYQSTGSQLYDLLIRPIENQLPPNQPLAIIATGALQTIPFETLRDKQTNQYLLEKYPIHYLTRLSKIQANPAPTPQTNRILAIANPKPLPPTADPQTSDLKGTETEADHIQQTFPGSQTYKNQQATLDAFKTQSPRFPILHLGTHGCFNPKGCPKLDMEPNTLLFANNQKYNIADAALLGLQNTQLIVIAACETAQNVDGVGLAGLAYIWERAGAKTTLASLWTAPDEVSAKIMTQFYNNLKQGMNKIEALRQAKLKYKDQHPYFWSPFILIGDGQ